MATEIPGASASPPSRPDPEISCLLAGIPVTDPAILNARWDCATVAPWNAGERTRAGRRLFNALQEVVQRVALVDDMEAQENAYYLLLDDLWEGIRERIVQTLAAGGDARTGYHGIGEESDRAAADRLAGGAR